MKDITHLNDLKAFAKEFLNSNKEGAIVGLSGELGTGKTTFVRYCIESIRYSSPKKIRVVSPSFVLHQSYDYLNPPVEHFDLYRLESINEETLIEVGYFETLQKTKEHKGFLFIEWPEKAKQSLLRLDCLMTFVLEEDKRSLSLIAITV